MAHSSSGLRHRTVTAEITGSNPVWVVYIYGVLVKRSNTPDFLSGIQGFKSLIRHYYGGILKLDEEVGLENR